MEISFEDGCIQLERRFFHISLSQDSRLRNYEVPGDGWMISIRPRTRIVRFHTEGASNRSSRVTIL